MRAARLNLARALAAGITRCQEWLARGRLVRLASLDERMLRDLGVARSDLAWALSLPLSVNAEAALYERARNNRNW
jgi:uncharacterized protein YjiS (DUF1127 family)